MEKREQKKQIIEIISGTESLLDKGQRLQAEREILDFQFGITKIARNGFGTKKVC